MTAPTPSPPDRGGHAPALTPERLRYLVDYNRDTGKFYWRAKSTQKFWAGGQEAGSTKADGYRRICLDGKQYLSHRVAWFYETGKWPREEIDHINGNKADNRISNLRECSGSQNHQNMNMSGKNTSGRMGVSWHKQRGKWQARITVQRKTICLGHFDDLERAGDAYLEAKRIFHTFSPDGRR